MRENPDLKAVSDEDLLRRLSELLRQSRRVESDLVAHSAEVDARRLYAREAAPSMFAYCTERLHLSEPEAYLRIAVARASRRHPALLTMPADGRLHLSGIERLAPHLTEENREGLLGRASHKSKRQIEELIAEVAPRPEARASMRKLPAPKGAGVTEAPLPSTGLRPDGVFRRLRRSTRTAAPLPGSPPARLDMPVASSVRTELVSCPDQLRGDRPRLNPLRRLASESGSTPAPSSATSWSGSRR